MGLTIHLEKRDEGASRCVYAFGPPGTAVGRAILHKESGDIELADLSSTEALPNERYYLAHVVPRLHAYHDHGTYPDSEQWEV